MINKNTYYKLPIDLKMIIAAYGHKKSKYQLNKTDIKNKWYVTLNYEGIIFKIPFKALFHTNDKIKGILGIDFNNALGCSSYKHGFCQICDQKYCYAAVFELQYRKSIYSKNGFLSFNSYYKGFLILKCLKVLYSNIETYNSFINYIDKKIKYLRFNVNSEFNNINDINLILDICSKCKNTIVYGYTARDDLMQFYKSNTYNNLYVNGSNKMYDNCYKATFLLEEYFRHNIKCLGSCNDCQKCFKLRNKTIITLFHNSNSDSILNTYVNRIFLVNLLNAIDPELNIKETDLKTKKGIFNSLNAFLIKDGCKNLKDMDIKNIKSFLDYLYYTPSIEYAALKDSNKKVLKQYGLI